MVGDPQETLVLDALLVAVALGLDLLDLLVGEPFSGRAGCRVNDLNEAVSAYSLICRAGYGVRCRS